MEHYCIKVKRRGVNYYTDYMERYFEKVGFHSGYHLTKRQEQSEFWCLTFTGEPAMNRKWITFTSDAFQGIPYEQLEELSSLIAECFKSVSIIQSVANGKRVYSANIPDFSIPEGVNIYSTKLSGKKKQDEIDMRSFGLLFVPKGSKEILRSMVVEIIPVAYPVNKAVLKAYGLKE